MDEQRPRVLIAGFTVVPASSADASALLAAARALAHRCEVDIVSIKTDALPHMELVGRARVLRVPLGVGGRPERASAFRRALRRQLEGEPYDVVHVRGALECGVAVEAKRDGAPFLLVYDMGAFPSEDDGPGAEDAWAAAHVRACAAADAIIAPSSAARAALPVPEARVEVIEPGVDIDQFDWEPSTARAPATPPALGRARSNRTTRVLYVGPYSSDRDIPTLVAAARILGRDADVRWLLAGEVDAARRARVRDMVASFGLDEVIDVRGEPDVQALPMVIASADLCVVPAAPVARYLEHGDVPQPLLEHMACKRPVVVAAVPGVRQIVRHEVEGLHYEAADEESLARQVRALVADPELRAALAEAGYHRARDDFNGASMRRRFLGVYQRLLDLDAAPAWGWFVADPSGVVSIGALQTSSGTDGEPLRTEHTMVLEGDELALAEVAAVPEDASTRPPPPVRIPSPDTAEFELPEAPDSSVLSVDTGAHRLPDLARAPIARAAVAPTTTHDTGRTEASPDEPAADTGPHRAPDVGPDRASDTSPHRAPDTSPHRAPDTSPLRAPDTAEILAPEDDGEPIDDS